MSAQQSSSTSSTRDLALRWAIKNVGLTNPAKQGCPTGKDTNGRDVYIASRSRATNQKPDNHRQFKISRSHFGKSDYVLLVEIDENRVVEAVCKVKWQQVVSLGGSGKLMYSIGVQPLLQHQNHPALSGTFIFP